MIEDIKTIQTTPQEKNYIIKVALDTQQRIEERINNSKPREKIKL